MFDKFYTPKIVDIAFSLGILAIIGVTGFAAFQANNMLHASLIMLGGVLGLVSLRVVCELLVIPFGIHDVLIDIRQKRLMSPPTPSTSEAAKSDESSIGQLTTR